MGSGVEVRAGADGVTGPLAAGEEVDSHRFQVAHTLVRANRFADREDADGRMALLDHVTKHVQVRVVRHSRLANPAHRGANRRLRAVDSLAAPEVELVAGATAAGAALTDELDPLGVFRALADIDHQAHQSPVVREASVHPSGALALTTQALVPADKQ